MENGLQKEQVKQLGSDKTPTELEKLTRFKDVLLGKPTIWDGLLKFITHPFLMLGGFALAIYFLHKTRKEKDSSLITELRNENKELRVEINALKRENKAFKGQLGLLPNDEYHQPKREGKMVRLGKKRIGVARLE